MVDDQLVDILTQILVVVALMALLPWVQMTIWVESLAGTTRFQVSEEEEGEEIIWDQLWNPD